MFNYVVVTMITASVMEIQEIKIKKDFLHKVTVEL